MKAQLAWEVEPVMMRDLVAWVRGMDGRLGMGDWLCCIDTGHGGAVSLESGGGGGDYTKEEDR